jgi:enterochelin esterase-like enzyme
MTPFRDLWRRGRRTLLALVGGPTIAAAARAQSVPVDRLDGFQSSVLGEARTIEVFLPLEYPDSGSTRYPVLYANDGQDMATIDLARLLGRLEEEGAIAPVIVVAMHAGVRNMDYGTAGTPNAQGLGARADRYEQFVLNELMPWIERRYRTLRGPASTGIMGWSLGGLSAFDLAWRHPDRIGTVGVFSGSFWWRTDDSSPEAKQRSRIMHRRVREHRVRPTLRLWFESGFQDESADRDGDGVIDSIQDTEELMAELGRSGYRRGREMVHLIVEGRHDLATWQRLLPEFLRWAFPPSPPPPA